MDSMILVFTLAGLLIGAALMWLGSRSQSATHAQRKAELERELASANTRLAQQQSEYSTLLAAKSAAEATLESERRNTKEKLDLLASASEEMKAQFKALASAALESSNAREGGRNDGQADLRLAQAGGRSRA
jgi:uncharacterized membrane-anchored protein YhcB (DUF1043 family)